MSKTRQKFINISLGEFMQMAMDAATKNGILETKVIHVSFSMDRVNDKNTPSFFVSYNLTEGDFWATGSLPQIAIDEAIAKRNIAVEKLIINAQTRFPATKPDEQIIEMQLKDGPLKTGIRFYAALNKKFTDLTSITIEQAMTEINQMLGT